MKRAIIGAWIFAFAMSAHAQIVNPGTTAVTTTWTPTLTGFAGTGLTASGVCQKVGVVSECVVTITGTTITAAAGTSTVSTPFTPARNSPAMVSVPTLIAIGNGIMQTSGSIAMPTISVGVSSLQISFQVFTI